MDSSLPIVVVGSIVLDSIRTPYGASKAALGGSAYYFAAAASFYTRVRMVACVGEDFPEEGRRFLEERGVDVEGFVTKPGKTFAYEAEYGDDPNHRVSLRTSLNVFESFHPVLPLRYRSTPVVFLGNIHPALQTEVLDQMEKPRHVAADTMNFWIHRSREDLEKLLPRVDTLFLNDSEAKELTGEKNLIRAIRRVCEFGPSTVVLKKGEHGAVLYREKAFSVVPAFPLEIVRDPTGGGDTFAGGVMGYLARAGSFEERSFREAMLHGTAAASFVVEEFGPKRLMAVTPERLEERLRILRAMVSPS